MTRHVFTMKVTNDVTAIAPTSDHIMFQNLYSSTGDDGGGGDGGCLHHESRHIKHDAHGNA